MKCNVSIGLLSTAMLLVATYAMAASPAGPELKGDGLL